MNIGENISKWFGYNYENKSAINVSTNEEQIRSQPKKPLEKKPDGYKSINSSEMTVRFLPNTNLKEI